MKVVEQKIKATDEDMSGQVSALKRAGVKAIALTTAPTQLASVAGVGAAQGLDVPIVGNNPTYDPALLKSPAAEAVKANAYIVASAAHVQLRPARPQAGRAGVRARRTPKRRRRRRCRFGWSQAQVMNEILNQACENKDLSREGLVKASRELSNARPRGSHRRPARLHEGRRAVDARRLHHTAGRCERAA